MKVQEPGFMFISNHRKKKGNDHRSLYNLFYAYMHVAVWKSVCFPFLYASHTSVFKNIKPIEMFVKVNTSEHEI